jgi:hypothetical protein
LFRFELRTAQRGDQEVTNMGLTFQETIEALGSMRLSPYQRGELLQVQ